MIRRGRTHGRGRNYNKVNNIPSQAILLQHRNGHSCKPERVAVELGCLFEGPRRNREVYVGNACDHDLLYSILYVRGAERQKWGTEK